ncbi:WG containing repeat-containing protein [Pseudomonas sp. ok272]|uniref:WG repeat-containing protein n=1 Tax=unclassified Pseudomonas TaxID=196821 RepID=UPI0008D8A586|nr:MULTISPECIES: WG repeat-containing protein [unclassified Pseudomonas]SEM33586.1 WG containing repeat-containing protein [Pseudomonas sp. ok272]SFM33481.1 WG containing repeat-containing protein [Pseudomonas sp. ok602]
MITDNVRASIKPKYLWLLLGALCSIGLLVIYLQTHASKVEREARLAANQVMKDELESELGDKTLAQIKDMLSEQIASLDDVSSLASLRLSATASDERDDQEVEPFIPPSAAEIQAKFDQHLDSLAFGQKIVGSFSYVQSDFREYGFNVIAPGYDEYQYAPVQIETTLVHFKDGSSMSPKTTDDADSVIVNANKRIVSVDLAATYTLPGTVKPLTFTEPSKDRQAGIALQSINAGEVTLTLPAGDADTLLNVQAFNAQGKALKLNGQSSYTNDAYYIEQLNAFLMTTVQRIDDGTISDKKQLASYYIDNAPSKEAIAKEHPPETLASYQFSGNPTSVIVYLKPSSRQRTHTFSITKTQHSYANGLTVAVDEHLDLYGLIDEQGQWLIKPAYPRLHQVADDYYDISDAKGDSRIYLLDRAVQTFTLQPFHIMNAELHQNRFLVINKDPSDNLVKGLVDIKTHEIILPLKYYNIEVNDPFITTLNYSKRKGSDVPHREVYRLSDRQLILSGEFYEMETDNGIVIVNSRIRSAKALKSRETQAMDGDGNYLYSNYDIYNLDGKRLNLEPYSEIYDTFGKDGLLLVTDIKDRNFYIQRDGQTAPLDLSSYEQLKPFSNGLAAVKGSDDLFGYIDTQGKRVIPFMYDDAGTFSGGTALAAEAGVYRLIAPDNQSVAAFAGDLRSSTTAKDGETARYTFVTANGEDDDVYTVYDQTGAVIPDAN